MEEHPIPNCLLRVPIDDIALDGSEQVGRGLCLLTVLDLFKGESVMERRSVPAERDLMTVVGPFVAL